MKHNRLTAFLRLYPFPAELREQKTLHLQYIIKITYSFKTVKNSNWYHYNPFCFYFQTINHKDVMLP